MARSFSGMVGSDGKLGSRGSPCFWCRFLPGERVSPLSTCSGAARAVLSHFARATAITTGTPAARANRSTGNDSLRFCVRASSSSSSAYSYSVPTSDRVPPRSAAASCPNRCVIDAHCSSGGRVPIRRRIVGGAGVDGSRPSQRTNGGCPPCRRRHVSGFFTVESGSTRSQGASEA